MPAGRPSHKPTDAKRGEVRALSAVGTKQELIARIVGIDPVTLRKHYAPDIEHGRAMAHGEVAKTLWQMATGNYPGQKVPNVIAAIFYSKTQMRWREVDEHPVPTFDYSRLPPKERRELHRLLTKAQRPGAPADTASDKLTVPPGGAATDAED